ncbi:MAG: FAD-dependent oxidoreductase, partial [Sphingorhabdus sp.]
IAHVEAQGVWAIEGGMSALAAGLEKLAREKGVQFRFGAAVKQIDVRNKAVAGVQLATGEYLQADK